MVICDCQIVGGWTGQLGRILLMDSMEKLKMSEKHYRPRAIAHAVHGRSSLEVFKGKSVARRSFWSWKSCVYAECVILLSWVRREKYASLNGMT